jgi:ATP-binding cassette, subfamily B, bacterial
MRSLSLRRVPFVAQMEVAECGAACLAMVLRHHRRAVPLEELRRQSSAGRDGVGAAALARAAREQGLEVRALKCGVGALPRLRTPAILHWEFNHFVVLEKAGRSFSLLDPAAGRRVVTSAEIERSFTGVALELWPGPRFQRARPGPHKRPLRFGWRRYLGAGATLFGITLALELFNLGVPILEQVILDHVVIAGHLRWFVPILAALVATAVATPLVRLVRESVLARFRCAASLHQTGGFVGAVMSRPLAFLLRRSAGDFLQRVRSHEQLQVLATRMVDAALDGLLLLGGAALLLAYDRLLAGLVLVHAVLRGGFLVASEGRARHHGASENIFRGRERAASADALGSIEILRGLHTTAHAERSYRGHLARRLNAGVSLARTSQATAAAISLFDGTAQAALLVKGSLDVMNGVLTPGTLAAFLTLSGLIREPLASLSRLCSDYVRFKAVEPAIRDVLEEEPDRWGQSTGTLSGGLELRDVSFRYPGAATDTLDSIDLRVEPGERLAIVGRSGSGKTTLGRVMAGLFECTGGAMLVDGVSPRSFTERALRRQVLLVTQDVFVCDGSIRLNLGLGLGVEEPPPEAVAEALRLAEADRFVAALPQGLETSVGPAGVALSGGERQRLALARALVARPRLLILDEATSCLDWAMEERILRNLGKLPATVVLITHRPQTLLHVDRVAVLDRGRLVQLGSPPSLLGLSGPLSELFGEERTDPTASAHG